LGALIRALLFSRALKGALTDAELLAATAVLERDGPHASECWGSRPMTELCLAFVAGLLVGGFLGEAAIRLRRRGER